MTILDVGGLYEAVKAAYPTTYGWQTDDQAKVTIDEWHKSLGQFPAWAVERAWAKYKAEVRIRELNLALFIGYTKDVLERDARESRPSLEEKEPERDEAWHAAKEACMRKCAEIFGGRW